MNHLIFLSIYYKNIRKHQKNNTLKIIAPAWKDELEFPNGFYSASDIQDYIEHIIKKHETLTTVPPIHVYTNRLKKLEKIKMDISQNHKRLKQ